MRVEFGSAVDSIENVLFVVIAIDFVAFFVYKGRIPADDGASVAGVAHNLIVVFRQHSRADQGE